MMSLTFVKSFARIALNICCGLLKLFLEGGTSSDDELILEFTDFKAREGLGDVTETLGWFDNRACEVRLDCGLRSRSVSESSAVHKTR